MAYSGEISETGDARCRFLLTIRDDSGQLFGSFPAATPAEAVTTFVEILIILCATEKSN